MFTRAQERLRGNALEGAGVSVDTPERSGSPKGVSGTKWEPEGCLRNKVGARRADSASSHGIKELCFSSFFGECILVNLMNFIIIKIIRAMLAGRR